MKGLRLNLNPTKLSRKEIEENGVYLDYINQDVSAVGTNKENIIKDVQWWEIRLMRNLFFKFGFADSLIVCRCAPSM